MPRQATLGLAREGQRLFHTPNTPGAPAFTPGTNLRSRKVHLKKPQIRFLSLCRHKSLVNFHTQNIFSSPINDTVVPPGDGNLYNFMALKFYCFNLPVFTQNQY